jgi:predicted esterase
MLRLLSLALALGVGLACAPSKDPWVPDEDPSFDATAPAELRAYSGDHCPTLTAGEVDFDSGDDTWKLWVKLPPEPDGAGVLFVHHGNGDDPVRFDTQVDGQDVADALDVIVVEPKAHAGGRGFAWPVPPNDPRPGVTLFDDVLACLDAQHGIDRGRVYVAGFSSGGLWTSFLTMARSSYLAASVIFSGGTDGTVPFSKTFVVDPWFRPAWDLPVLLTTGGAKDVAFLDFGQMTRNMTEHLRDDGHTAVLCTHDGGHALPDGFGAWAWPFLAAHALDGSTSPYADGDPTGELPRTCTWE